MRAIIEIKTKCKTNFKKETRANKKQLKE